VGGVGLVAVGLAHKRQGVAKELVRFFLSHFRQRGSCLAALYPFRPDFYGQMGFGYGTKLSQYRVRPAALPRGPRPAHVAMLSAADREAIERCYYRYYERTHGIIERFDITWTGMFDNHKLRWAGYRDGDELRAYVQFELKADTPGNVLKQDMIVHELVYERPEALAELLTFLHLQFDQVDRIVINTQDDYFHFLLTDPRNGSDRIMAPVYHESNSQGVGLMYRVINAPRFFELLGEHSFGGQSCDLRLELRDSFFPENAGVTAVRFADGRPRLIAPAQASRPISLALDVADFSSLALGVAPFTSLWQFGRAQIGAEADIATVDALFRSYQPPVCLTRF
jgi:predicted acetyltransferase